MNAVEQQLKVRSQVCISGTWFLCHEDHANLAARAEAQTGWLEIWVETTSDHAGGRTAARMHVDPEAISAVLEIPDA